MSTDFLFIDVVLPLPLPKLLTYSIEGVSSPVDFGMRVVVQVGAKKRYTAVVWRLHNDRPVGYVARPIESVVDEYPVVVELQRSFWEWMANHNM